MGTQCEVTETNSDSAGGSCTDRQAAEAVRARIDFKYALALELTDPGFDFSVLSEFRDRLIEADAGRRLLDGILASARDKGLLKTAGQLRTDSTHVRSSARELSWLEMVAETLRSALNALAQAAPSWLAEVAEPDWFRHYATRVEESRFPKARAKRDAVGLRAGADGMRLLEAVFATGAPHRLRDLQEVQVLRQIWVQHFTLAEGEVTRRDPRDRPPGATRLVTSYAPEACGSVKRDILWDGCKVHLTETCEPDAPNLITNVATTVATVPDNAMSGEIHASLAERDCLPGEHWVDAGYPTAATIVTARREHGLELHGPIGADTTAQDGTDDKAFSQDSFTINWENQHVTCPGGRTSSQWREALSHRGTPVIRVRFSPTGCRPCPHLRDCVSSPKAVRRELTFRHHDEHQAIGQARALQQTDDWKERYKIRAGVEGTFSQGIQRCGLRRSRYRGLAKTSIQHHLTGAAINLARIDAHLTDTPRAHTTSQHFAPPSINNSTGRSDLNPELTNCVTQAGAFLLNLVRAAFDR